MGVIERLRYRIGTTTHTIPHERLSDLVFGQQHILTQGYFVKRYGQCHTITLPQFPHYQALGESGLDPDGAASYEEYLRMSWDYRRSPGENTRDARLEKISIYRSLYEDVSKCKSLGVDAIRFPIIVSERPDGRLVLAEGNHRAAIALKLGLDIRAVFVSASSHLRDFVGAEEKLVGKEASGRPYQSIHLAGKLVVKGHRTDMLQRMEKVNREDIQGKSILDLGCSIGMSAFLAAERGAKRVVGVDVCPRIASTAVGLNAFFAQPAEFVQHDLNSSLSIGEFDTAFCFSVADQLKTHDGLVQTIRSSVRKVVYFEGDAETTERDYPQILTTELFSDVTLLGHNRDGNHSRKSRRPFYKCSLA
jgi:hypothetical protein